MRFFWKKHNKIIFISILIIATLCCLLLPVHLYTNASRWKYNVDHFEEYENDFNKIASFCNNYISTKKAEGDYLYNWFSVSKTELYYDGNVIILSDELHESLSNICTAFPHKDAKLDVIRCTDDTVYFCTHNGQYSLVYSPYSKPKSANDIFKESIYTKSICHDWYHVRKNNK